MTNNPITYICPLCGSDNLSFDAAAEWYPTLQQFEVRTTYDSTTCESCGEEIHPHALGLRHIPQTLPLRIISLQAAEAQGPGHTTRLQKHLIYLHNEGLFP